MCLIIVVRRVCVLQVLFQKPGERLLHKGKVLRTYHYLRVMPFLILLAKQRLHCVQNTINQSRSLTACVLQYPATRAKNLIAGKTYGACTKFAWCGSNFTTFILHLLCIHFEFILYSLFLYSIFSKYIFSY